MKGRSELFEFEVGCEFAARVLADGCEGVIKINNNRRINGAERMT
jgi:hypothetical protein